jgi:ABC-type Na+ efflux pump permease subunit
MPAATLARLVVLEARRGGLPWLALAGLLIAMALAGFLSQVALTESREMQLAIVAPLLRACAVLLVALHVASSTLREMQDKTLELALSLPLARSTQYLGRLAGHAACAALLALALALPLAAWVPAGPLALEATLVASAALFFAMSLAQLVPTIAASIGFYLLARAIAAVQALAGPELGETSLATRAARLAVDGVALLLPRLDAVTRTEWLLYGAPPSGAYAAALAGMAIYGLLLTAAGLFDFHRKQL